MISLEYPFVNNKPQFTIIVKSPLTGMSIQVVALIDTGADNCLFPRYVPTTLGHALKDHGVADGMTYGVEEHNDVVASACYRLDGPQGQFSNRKKYATAYD